mgnify:FL=1
MTPSDYSNSSSLEHDAMQAGVFEWLRDHGRTTMNGKDGEKVVPLKRAGIWVETPIKIGGALRGFIDILERWEPAEANVSRLQLYIAYEIKPRLTSIGGLIRQMHAEKILIEQWASNQSSIVWTVPVVRIDDEHLSLLRRLWSKPVGLWDETNGVVK